MLTLAGRAAEPAKAPRVLFMIGEPEYDTKTTLPEFAKSELEPRGVVCQFALAASDQTDDFVGLDALTNADLLFISVRRHAPIPAQMALIRSYIASGKPVAGIRTASHAFGKRKGETEGAWEKFDAEVLGGDYQGHYERGIPTFVKPILAMTNHPVLAGIPAEEFRIDSHLYKNPNLPPYVTQLMTARMEGHPDVQPVAWVNTHDHRRVFYTSLGDPKDFQIPQYRRLLVNGIFWAMDKPVAAKQP